MGALTQDERDGLDDVFLSIHNVSKLEKIKNLSTLIFSNFTSQNITKGLKRAKYGLKERKISHFFLNLAKKKKNLSK
ncbi:MAG: hypothetical protein ABGW85_03760 [Sulfurimonas sp.]